MARVGCLPNGNFVVFLQTILYFVASFLGFFITIPIGITLRNFSGSCILYGQILIWGTAIIWPWSEPSCQYILYMNLAINVFYATFMGVVSLTIALKGFRTYSSRFAMFEDWRISFILTAFNPVFLIINSLITSLEVASVAIITDGFSKFCNYTMSYVGTLPNNQTQKLPTTCSGLQSWNGWSQMRIVRGATMGVDGHNFFGCLTLATIANWLVMFVWFVQLVLNVFMSCRVCSCDVAEEKRRPDKSVIVAQRRSRLATPIATPGGQRPGGFGPSTSHPASGQQTPRGVVGPAPPSATSKDPYLPQAPSSKDPYFSPASSKGSYFPPPSEPPRRGPGGPPSSMETSLPPPYRVTPPAEDDVDLMTPQKQDEPPPPPMSVLKEKPVYRRNQSGSQI